MAYALSDFIIGHVVWDYFRSHGAVLTDRLVAIRIMILTVGDNRFEFVERWTNGTKLPPDLKLKRRFENRLSLH